MKVALFLLSIATFTLLSAWQYKENIKFNDTLNF